MRINLSYRHTIRINASNLYSLYVKSEELLKIVKPAAARLYLGPELSIFVQLFVI